MFTTLKITDPRCSLSSKPAGQWGPSQREATRESSFVSVIVFTTSRLAIQLALMNLTVFSSFAGGGSLFSSFGYDGQLAVLRLSQARLKLSEMSGLS